MQKAVIVTEFQGVKDLNKLLDQGYTIQSTDGRGVYILNEPELKSVPIKDNIEAVVSLDVSKTKRQLKLLEETDKALKEKYEEKQPHVRIEFDDIRDVRKVWVDGELIGGVDDKPLVSLKIDWNTDTETENHKGFDINYQDLTGERPMSRGFHEGSVM